MSDGMLGWLNGDEQDIHEIFALYYPKAVRFAVLSGLSLEDAQDCAQEAFTLAFHRRHQLRDVQAFPLWFHRIVASRVMDTFITRKRRGETSLDTLEDVVEDWQRQQSIQPEEVSLENEQREQIWLGIQHLAPKPRLALVLRYYGGFSVREVAEILDVREGTLRVMIHRALAQLRLLLDFHLEVQPSLPQNNS